MHFIICSAKKQKLNEMLIWSKEEKFSSKQDKI
jgi:hypothetical protein